MLLIFVNAFYFVKYLYRHFYVQKGLRFLSGKESIGYDTIKLWKECQGKILKPKDKEAFKDAAEKATKAINATAVGSGMSGKGVSPTSMAGTRDIAATLRHGTQTKWVNGGWRGAWAWEEGNWLSRVEKVWEEDFKIKIYL